MHITCRAVVLVSLITITLLRVVLITSSALTYLGEGADDLSLQMRAPRVRLVVHTNNNTRGNPMSGHVSPTLYRLCKFQLYFFKHQAED